MRAIVVDAFDSFTHIIYQYLRELGVETTVVRSGAGNPEALVVSNPDFVVLGPGPGHPADSGHVEIVQATRGSIPLFGVCLGHQAIGLAFGGTVGRAAHLMHGKTSRIRHDQTGALREQPQDFDGCRYHSLIVEEPGPPELVVTARSLDDGYIMGLRHSSLPIESVQFHPESIGTQSGMSIFASFLATVEAYQLSHRSIAI